MDPSLRANLLLMDPRFSSATMQSHSAGATGERGGFDLSYDEARTNDVLRPLSNEQVSAGLTLAGQGFSARLGLNAFRYQDGTFSVHNARPGLDLRVGDTTLGMGYSHTDTPFGSRGGPLYRAEQGVDLGNAGRFDVGIMHDTTRQTPELMGGYSVPLQGGRFGVQIVGPLSKRARPQVTFGYRQEF